jgi:hypothetical protein
MGVKLSLVRSCHANEEFLGTAALERQGLLKRCDNLLGKRYNPKPSDGLTAFEMPQISQPDGVDLQFENARQLEGGEGCRVPT